MVTISGVKFKTTGRILTAPKSDVVLAYLKAVKGGKSKSDKLLKVKKSK